MYSPTVRIYKGGILRELTDKDIGAFVNEEIIPALNNIPYGWGIEYNRVLHLIREVDTRTVGINYIFFPNKQKNLKGVIFDDIVKELETTISKLDFVEMITKC